jgi:hypothetical protein
VFPGEFAIAWNEQGRPGATGTNGTNGVNGVNGATKVVVRTGTSVGFFARADCQTGEVATGGGVAPANSGAFLGLSVPETGSGDSTDGQTPTGWRVWSNAAGGTTAYVVCASP